MTHPKIIDFGWMENKNKITYTAMIIGSAKFSRPSKRRIVSCNIVLSPTNGKYCLGYCLRDSGHSRVPEPPERMTGIISISLHFHCHFLTI